MLERKGIEQKSLVAHYFGCHSGLAPLPNPARVYTIYFIY
uniref:Uncharacterized protein n=1 Tax=Rhizophora mucronata TaxID=61149 RepID=A0A2P2QV89_RHIMU